MPKLILLNGAPGVGKDTIAQEIWGSNDVSIRSFKKPLITQALAMSGLDKQTWDSRYNDRALKDRTWDKLGGLSCREFLIKISEVWVKPIFGSDFYAKQATQNLWPREKVIYTDAGFQSELDAAVEAAGPSNVYLIQINRGEHSFDGDSRTLLKHTPENTLKLSNNGTVAQAAESIINFINN